MFVFLFFLFDGWIWYRLGVKGKIVLFLKFKGEDRFINKGINGNYDFCMFKDYISDLLELVFSFVNLLVI